MASTPERRIRIPVSRKPALRRTPAGADIHALTSQLSLDDPSKDSPPATPGLEWAETPQAIDDPPTPENDLDPDEVIRLPYSPLAARKTALEQHVIPLLEADAPEELPSHLSSEAGQSKRLFQNELSKSTWTVPSQLHPPSSTDTTPSPPLSLVKTEAAKVPSFGIVLKPFYVGPSGNENRNDTIREYSTSGGLHTVAFSIKREDLSVQSQHVVATEHQTDTVTTTPATEPSPRLGMKKPLSLSLAWSLSTKLSTILPLEAIERFDDSPSTCIATTKEGNRCKNSVARTANKSFLAELSKALSSFACSLDFEAFAEHMKPLIESITCTRWHREAVRRCLEELCSYSWRPLMTAPTTSHQANAIANSIASTFKLWISALTSIPTTDEGTVVPIKGDADNVQGSLYSDTASAAATAATEGSLTHFHYASTKAPTESGEIDLRATNKSTTITPKSTAMEQQVTGRKPVRLSTHLNHDFVEFPYSKAKRNVTPQDLIRQILLEKLTPADMKRAGFIYIFWHPGSMGYVKIGYATNVEKRLQAWRNQCKFSLEQHKSPESMASKRVRHLHRVESLIHAELKDYRRLEPSCRGCGRRHIEWFEVDPSYALKVVAKWTSRTLYSGRHLDPSINDEEIDQLCELTRADTYLPRPRPKKVKGSSRRSTRGRQRGVK
ncbi:hypothetical protein AYL99_06573 [Fonsecaea erecta]|uniref:Bacteriophage T5 Orf172 DNA-binding domain-containing protein n=1 Tax=Fonsecaea erecta TaxID=1367422 RepID=A0A178ZJR4_9EURO|nr:hypothetical protein AYL99_06573 [Fonsecaea erecta]OAP59275.1 hypothetical protein AYL99_06573 [Fonsecaea erecta]